MIKKKKEQRFSSLFCVDHVNMKLRACQLRTTILISICNNFNHNSRIRIQIFKRDAVTNTFKNFLGIMNLDEQTINSTA